MLGQPSKVRDEVLKLTPHTTKMYNTLNVEGSWGHTWKFYVNNLWVSWNASSFERSPEQELGSKAQGFILQMKPHDAAALAVLGPEADGML